MSKILTKQEEQPSGQCSDTIQYSSDARVLPKPIQCEAGGLCSKPWDCLQLATFPIAACLIPAAFRDGLSSGFGDQLQHYTDSDSDINLLLLT